MRDRRKTARGRIEDLEARSRRVLTGANGGSGSSSGVSLPIAESDVTSLITDLATLTASIAAVAAAPFYDGLFFDARCNGSSGPTPVTNCGVAFATISGSTTAAYDSTLGSWAWNWVIGANNIRLVTINDGGGSSPACYSRNMYPALMARMKFNALTDTEYYFGFSTVSPIAVTTPANSMFFRFKPGDSSWRCITKSGTTETDFDSGVTVAISTKYKLDIKTNSSSNVEFRINDVLVHTESTNLPVAATKMTSVGHFMFQVAGSPANADIVIQGIRFMAPVQ